jgi:calcineurin-like phosphoesterase family protein
LTNPNQTISNADNIYIKVSEVTSLSNRIVALEEIVALQDQYTQAIIRGADDTDTRKEILQDAIDEYYDVFGILLGIEL